MPARNAQNNEIQSGVFSASEKSQIAVAEIINMAKSNDISIRQVGPKAAKRSIRKAIQTRRPTFLWGPPGIGKSDLVKQIGDDFGREVIDVRLALWEPTDIKGIPYYSANDNTMAWAKPAELPDDEMAAQHEMIILFLDEMNSAAPAVQAAAYQLILNRKVGTYKLPDNVVIIAAGNREADKGVTYRMPAPLANRFVHLELAVSFDDWFQWAVVNNQHADVVGYLQFAKKDLYDFDPKSPSRSFATPRSWTFVSETIEDVEDFTEEEVTDMVAAGIGEGIALKFKAHREIAGQLPNPSDILSGSVTELNTDNISAKYSLTTALCYELKSAFDNDEEEKHKWFDNFLAFIQANFEAEMVVMATTIALSKYGIRVKFNQLNNYKPFIAKYGKLIEQA